MLARIPDQMVYIGRLFLDSDVDWMDRNSFRRLCFLMTELRGLVDHRYVNVEEQGCLGALDGTRIDLHVPSSDKPRFNKEGSNLYECIRCFVT
ncbi:hypothetical protein ACS0TY_019668 [Phlomoides rotata]